MCAQNHSPHITTRHPQRRMTTLTVERSRLPYKSRQSCAETLTGFRPRGPSIHNQGNRRPEPARVRLIVVVVEAPIRVHVPRVVRIVLGGAWLFVVKDESWDKQETQPHRSVIFLNLSLVLFAQNVKAFSVSIERRFG